MIHISVIGTGYIAQRFVKVLQSVDDIELDFVLTRREVDKVWTIIPKVTRDPAAILKSDIIVDLAGDAKYLYSLIENYIHKGKIVTFNSEFHVTYPYLHYKFPDVEITEGEGDQPGSFAMLAKKAELLNLDPSVFINHKRFLDYNPAPEPMKQWAKYYGLSEKITVASTDGTKVSFETAFIANAYGLKIPTDGKKSYYFREGYPPIGKGDRLAYVELTHNKGIDVSAVADKTTNIKDLEYLGVKVSKCMDKKYWATLSIPYHLCQYDIINTIRDLYHRDEILLNGSFGTKMYDVYTISKTWLSPGDIIKTGIGGYDVRGEAHRVNENILPIIDCENVRVKASIEPGQPIEKDMVEPIS